MFTKSNYFFSFKIHFAICLWESPTCCADLSKLPLKEILESLGKVVVFIIVVTGPFKLIIIWAPWPWGALKPDKNTSLLLSYLPHHHYCHHFQSWHWKQYRIVFAILEWHCSVISVVSVIISSNRAEHQPKVEIPSVVCILQTLPLKVPF